jgi:2'-5' RNA ligase
VWPDVEVFDDHRLWRPEWTESRPCVYWYLTFADLPAVAELGERAAGRLGKLAGVDLVPSPWLHLTLCDVGFLDELEGSRLEAMTQAVADALRLCPPLELTLGPVAFFPDAVTLAAGPHPELLRVRHRIGRAMGSVGLVPQHHHARDFWPHVTLGYPNRRVERREVLDALGDADATVTARVDQVTLAAVSRREGHYQWDTGAVIALEEPGRARRQPVGTGEPSTTGSESTP